MGMIGVSLASVVLLWSLIGTCVAVSVNMQEGYSLNGEGFVFLALQMFFVISAVALFFGLRRKSTSSSAAEEVHKGTEQQSQATKDAPPTLLSNARKTEDKDLEKCDAAKNVDAAAAVVVGAA